MDLRMHAPTAPSSRLHPAVQAVLPGSLRAVPVDLGAFPWLRPIEPGQGLPGLAPATAREEAPRPSLEPQPPALALEALRVLVAGPGPRDGAWLRAVTRATRAAQRGEGLGPTVAGLLRRARREPAQEQEWEAELPADDDRRPTDPSGGGDDGDCDRALGRLALQTLIAQVGGEVEGGPIEVSLLGRDGGEPDGPVTFRYRQRSFQVPWSWLCCYLGDWMDQQASEDPEAAFGQVSGTADVLAILWPTLQAAATAAGADARGDYDDLLGCYALPGLPWNQDRIEDYRFWSRGYGAPMQAHALICRMVHTYSAHIHEPFTGTDACDADFGEFVRAMLRGKSASNYEGSCTSGARIHYLDGPDEAALTFASLERWPVDIDGIAGRTVCGQDVEVDCGAGFQSGECPTRWEDLALEWMPLDEGKYGYFYHGWRGQRDEFNVLPDPNYEGFNNAWPGRMSSCTNIGYAPSPHFDVQLHSIDHVYTAFLLDWMLFVGRIAWDFHRSLDVGDTYEGEGRQTWRIAAVAMGRYALAAASERGKLLIHELGHSYHGGGHCDVHCCFETASVTWRCRVLGFLGLPHGALHSHGYDDYATRQSSRLDCDDCAPIRSDGVDALVEEPADYTCTLHDPWETLGGSTVCVDLFYRFKVTFDGFGTFDWEPDKPQDVECESTHVLR